MSDSYAKLFSSITDSTIWQAPDGVRLVWITMLAMSDEHGYVGASVPGLAGRARVPMEVCIAALESFMGPDQWSRTKDHEGRRIAEADGGWVLLNHAKYRAIRDADTRRARAKVAMADLRSERKQKLTVSNVSHGEPPLAHTEADTEADIEREDQKIGEPAVPKVAPKKIQLNLPEWLSPDVWEDWHKFRNVGKGWTKRARELSLAKLETLHAAGHDPKEVIEQSIERGWTGLFTVKSSREITSQTGPTSKAGQAILLLERLKNEQRRTDIGIPAKAALLGFGGHASG